jgi:hypothetical protein
MSGPYNRGRIMGNRGRIMGFRIVARVGVVAVFCATAVSASAQSLPAEPLTFASGRVVLSGDVAGTIAPEDLGFFNYGDYEHSTLREFRAGVSAMVKAAERVAVLAEIRSENLDVPQAYALYARIRPLPQRRFDIQIGRIPPTFGGFPRRAYARDNPLIGYPLAYQYLTSLRADALPASVDELLRMRGRGWLSNFSIGNTAPDRGVPVTAGLTWDTGVQVSSGWKAIDATVAVTTGSPSRPLVTDDNAGKQVATRVVVHASPALAVGASFARGAFVSRRALTAIGANEAADHAQQAIGIDGIYQAGHLTVRGELIHSSWELPLPQQAAGLDLKATAVTVESKYAFLPGAYAAVRVERLTFNRLTGTTQVDTWDAPVDRVEVGGGYYLQRNLIARVSLQFNERAGGRVTSSQLAAVQLLFWF